MTPNEIELLKHTAVQDYLYKHGTNDEKVNAKVRFYQEAVRVEKENQKT